MFDFDGCWYQFRVGNVLAKENECISRSLDMPGGLLSVRRARCRIVDEDSPCERDFSWQLEREQEH